MIKTFNNEWKEMFLSFTVCSVELHFCIGHCVLGCVQCSLHTVCSYASERQT